MRKLLTVLVLVVVLVFSVLFGFYLIRKSNSDNSLVSPISTRVISIAVDELLLDNLSSLWNFPKDSEKTTYKQDLPTLPNFIWSSGIEIPTRINLFALPKDELTYYGVLKVKNYDASFSYFAKYFADSIEFLDKEKDLVKVKVNDHLQLVFNSKYLIYQLSPYRNQDIMELVAIQSQSEQLTNISSLEGFLVPDSLSHITYLQKDQTLSLQGTLSDKTFTFSGQLATKKSLNAEQQVIKLDPSNEFLRFYSLIGIEDFPLIRRLISDFITVENPELLKGIDQYIDLQITKDIVIQNDTFITIDYDQDFNEIETKAIQEIQVPMINLLLENTNSKQQVDAVKAFYTFYPVTKQNYLHYSTRTSPEDTMQLDKASQPIYLTVNFDNIPDQWSYGEMAKFQSKGIKLEVTSEKSTENMLNFQGHISY